MTYTRVDNSKNFFPGVSIADLVVFTEFLDTETALDIYTVQEQMERDWWPEIKEWRYEYAEGYWATFKDGSSIFISAERKVDPR